MNHWLGGDDVSERERAEDDAKQHDQHGLLYRPE